MCPDRMRFQPGLANHASSHEGALVQSVASTKATYRHTATKPMAYVDAVVRLSVAYIAVSAIPGHGLERRQDLRRRKYN
jgi:hypothetical protein